MNLILQQKGELTNYRTTPELAAFLGRSVPTLNRWVAAGKLGEPAARSPLGWALWSPEQCERALQWVRWPGLYGPPGKEEKIHT